MERCPHCGSPSREGAKFCTTCGYRFPGSEAEAPAGSQDEEIVAGPVTGEPAQAETGAADAWPAPPDESPTDDSPWSASAPAAVADGDAADEVIATTWPQSPTIWRPQPPETPPAIEASNDENGGVVEPEAIPPTLSSTNADATASLVRATGLLDDLRVAFAELGQAVAPDLSGVISDLEVATTPPGALDGAELASLREALLSARERPRDIDTILDLSQRIDAVIALMIAYDRAIAAIERSLAVLKR